MQLETRCYSCEAPIIFAEGKDICRCGACGRFNSRPKSEKQESDLMKYANERRNLGEFDKAEAAYDKVLQKNLGEHEARWGILLCRRGVIYLEDAATGEVVITCRRTANASITTDPDFKRACEDAPVQVRRQYERDAEYIDAIQREIRGMGEEDGCDVFICYKETEPGTGERTEDSRRALSMYQTLTRRGFRVFYAPVSLKNHLGANYEAAIFHAIETAQVMLALGTKAEYFRTTWMQSEWRRFLEKVDAGERKLLIPLYQGFAPSQLPEEFSDRFLQGLDMSDMGFMFDLENMLDKVVRKDDEVDETQRLREEIERMKKAEEERLRNEEQERLRKAEEELAKFRKAEEERLRNEEQERLRKAEEELAKFRKAEEERLRNEEQERLKKAEEELAKFRKAEEERLAAEKKREEKIEEVTTARQTEEKQLSKKENLEAVAAQFAEEKRRTDEEMQLREAERVAKVMRRVLEKKTAEEAEKKREEKKARLEAEKKAEEQAAARKMAEEQLSKQKELEAVAAQFAEEKRRADEERRRREAERIAKVVSRVEEQKANEEVVRSAMEQKTTAIKRHVGPDGEIIDSWEQIFASIDDGSYKTKYAIGNTKLLDLGPEGEVHMQIVAFDVDERADGKGKAPITWISKELLKTQRRMYPEYSLKYAFGKRPDGWMNSELRKKLKTDVMPKVPANVAKRILTVKKVQPAFDNAADEYGDSVDESTVDDLWIPSYKEIWKGPYSEVFSDKGSCMKDGVDDRKLNWWLRSIRASCAWLAQPEKMHYFAEGECIKYDGTWASTILGARWGVALGFCT